MRKLKRFEEFLSLGLVKRQKSDDERARNLVLEAEDKFEFFCKVKEKVGISELSPNYVVETCYDVLIELLRAKLLRAGYKTDSHEVEVSYMRNLGFSEESVGLMNDLRYFRNGIKYYGRRFDREYAGKVLSFLDDTYDKLKKEVDD